MEAQRRLIRVLWAIAALALLVTAAGLLGLDQAVARWTAGMPDRGTIWDKGTALLDLVALKTISTFLLGFLLLVVAAVLVALRRTRRTGWVLLYLGAVQFAATVTADLSKPQLGRLRPFEAAQQSGGDTWFVGANSFPSGHEAFYAGLFLPLMLLFPRAAWLFAIPPLFVAAARVAEHDHYLSDVTASIALAALLSIAFRFLLAKADPNVRTLSR
jgi:membrane-associated phospholipid phosphatase